MKIRKIAVSVQSTPLKTPFVTALRRVETAESYIVTIYTDELVGYGAASPTAAITGDTAGSIICAIRDYIAPKLVGRELSEELLPIVQAALIHNCSPKAAVDIALYDLLSQKENKSFCDYISGGAAIRKELETDITIALGAPEKMAKAVEQALSDGWRIFKIKLGGDLDSDGERIKAISRVIDNKCVVRLDANQGWSAETTLAVEELCFKYNIKPELIEQPLKYDEDSSALKRKLKTPLLADESVFTPMEAKRILETKQADYINIKLMKSAGITGALKICEIAKNCMLGCMLEGAIGIIAAAQLAACKSEITMIDLDAVMLCEYNPCISTTVFDKSKIYINNSHKGLGIRSPGETERICMIK